MKESTQLKYAIVETRIGYIAMLGSEAGLRSICIYPSSKKAIRDIKHRFPESIMAHSDFEDLADRLKRYARGENVSFDEKFDIADATSFQRDVWMATRSIPRGETRSYSWVARMIGRPRAARAVGQALNGNLLPIVVPCHRVIGKSGSLTGFSGGIDLKRRLLDMESSSP